MVRIMRSGSGARAVGDVGGGASQSQVDLAGTEHNTGAKFLHRII